jgi:hypothetical protein
LNCSSQTPSRKSFWTALIWRRCVFGERWKEMDQTHFHAYFGVLILAGVFRSSGEPTESLWDAETDREPFHATMSLENLHIISRIIRFDNRDTRPARQQRDKLAAIRSVWDKWVDSLPLFYNPGLPLLLMSSLAYAI